MRWLLATCLLGGCSLVWNPDGYVGGDASVIDGGVDARDEDPDADLPDAAEDAGSDASVDVGSDAPSCMQAAVDSSVQVRLGAMETYRDIRLTYSGSDSALAVGGADVLIENVEIVITGSGNGIQLTPEADGTMINNVRVVYAGPTRMPGLPFQNQTALQARGDAGDTLDGIRVTNFQVEGLEGIRVRDATDAEFSMVRIFDPEGRGTSSVGAETHAGIEMRTVQGGVLRDFSIESASAGVVNHAIYLDGCSGLTVEDGLVAVARPTEVYAVSIVGSAVFASTMTRVGVTGALAGIEFVGSGSWALTSVKVVREADCGASDFAFRNSASMGIDLERCSVGGTCVDNESDGPFSGDVIDRVDDAVEARPPLDLCPVSS